MECQYVATQRGGVALVFEGHRYNKVRDGKDGTVYWRCSRDRQCPGRAVTVNNRVKKANNKHNHAPEASLRNGNANPVGMVSNPLSLPGSHHHHASSHHSSSTHHHHQSPSSSSSHHHHHHSSHTHHQSSRQQSNHSPSGTSGRGISPSFAQSEAPLPLRLPSSSHSSTSLTSQASALEAQNAMAAMAAAFPASIPAIMTELFRNLAAVSAGNPQMAAYLASSLALNNNNNDSKETNRFPLRPFMDHQGPMADHVNYIPGGKNIPTETIHLNIALLFPSASKAVNIPFPATFVLGLFSSLHSLSSHRLNPIPITTASR